MVRLVNDDHTDALERIAGPRPHAQGLDHGDYKIIFNFKLILLDAPDGGARAKLLNAFDPLICKESLVDYDERSSLELGGEGQRANGFSQSHIE
jgi:hypothetical protein